MDPERFGLYGGIAGSVIGVMGGLIGTYCSLKYATRPRERALTILLASTCWLWIAGVVAFQAFVPLPWSRVSAFLILPPLLLLPKMARRATQARVLDQADAMAS